MGCFGHWVLPVSGGLIPGAFREARHIFVNRDIGYEKKNFAFAVSENLNLGKMASILTL